MEKEFMNEEVSSEDERDDEEEEEEDNHEELIQNITSLGSHNVQDNDEEEDQESTDDKKNIDATQLLQGVTNKSGIKQLKKRLNKLNEYLLKPLPSVQKDRIHRKLAYERSSKQVSEWDSVVKHNKKAEHLQFPLQEEVPPLPSLTTRIDSFKAVTPLEVTVQNMLSKSDHVIEDGEELSKAEKRALLKLSIQEAKERRAELSKMRSLLSAYEQKQRRINRIKSKKFHKIQRKIKEKTEEKKGISEEDLLEKANKLRAQERATLKHSKMTKWAKNHISKKHRDPATRLALTEQGRLKTELKQKAYQESDSDEENISNNEEVVEEDNLIELPMDPNNTWLSVNNNSKGDLGDLNEEGKIDFEEELERELEEEEDDKSDSDSIDQDGSLQVHEKRKRDDTIMQESKRVKNVIDPTDFLTTESLRDDLNIKNAQAVKEAFADDDVVDEFLKEKEREVEGSKPKNINLTLPGWGEWGGLGVDTKKNKRKRQRDKEKQVPPPPPPRKDDHLKYVIFNHSQDKKASKHYVSQLPYSYKDKQLFAKKMATPIGRHWNTETHFNEAIKPRIRTKIGAVIEPMKMTDELEQFIKKTKQDRQKRKHS